MRHRFKRRKSSSRPLPEDLEEEEKLHDPTAASPASEIGEDIMMVESPSQPGPAPRPIVRDRASMNSHEEKDRQPSRASTPSSHSSRHSSVQIAPPAEALKTQGDIDGDGDDDDAEEDVDEHAFDHPSTYKPAPWIWIPKDELGLSDVILEELRAVGIEASDVGAIMTDKARVKVKYVCDS